MYHDRHSQSIKFKVSVVHHVTHTWAVYFFPCRRVALVEIRRRGFQLKHIPLGMVRPFVPENLLAARPPRRRLISVTTPPRPNF